MFLSHFLIMVIHSRTVKACTHRQLFTESAVKSVIESADAIPESTDYTINSVIVGRLPLSNMFNILNPRKSANRNLPTIAVGRREIVPVGTGLNSHVIRTHVTYFHEHTIILRTI